MKKLLIKLNTCEETMMWATGKSWKEIFETCHRGDWLLWLFYKTMDRNSEEHFRLLIVAKGHCANTVWHLMKDERSIKAVDAAMNYSGDRQALKTAAAYVADAAAYVADAADAAAYVAYARKENQKLTADICRKYLPMDVWNIDSNLLWE